MLEYASHLAARAPRAASVFGSLAYILSGMADLHEYKEKPGACAQCGNSPVNHPMTYAFNLLNVPFNELSYRHSASRILAVFERAARALMETFEAINLRALHLLRGVTYGTDISKARTYRSQVIWEEAKRRGIAMEQVYVFGIPTDIYRAHLRGAWQYFKSIPVPPEVSQAAYLWIDDKFLLKRELTAVGIPVPDSRSVTSPSDAREALTLIGAPVVVKPRAGSRGRHTTTFVTTVADLDAAFASAQQLCRHVSVEKCLLGPVCRATVIQGRLAGFFAAYPPLVIGDGVSTIGARIAAWNNTLPDRVQPITLTPEHHAFMRRRGVDENTVLEKGTTMTLSHRTGRLFGGTTRELLDTVHPKLRAYVENAAQELDVPVVGFDLIIPDPETDPDAQQWGIIEANSLPFIDLHYLPLYGAPSNPAAQVWDMWAPDTK